jgi:hypothetical protein
MSATLQRAPEPSRRGIVYTTTTSGGDGGPPTGQIGTLEMQLSNDGRQKSALHRLVLVLPITLLIFAEALRHPNEKIELPILKLEIEIQLILPIFLLIISYMLYRAIRYSRIILWNVPDYRVVQIALDDTEAYKMNSAYYEEVLDPMAADLVKQLPERISAFGQNTIVGLNLLKSIAVYVSIFLMLVYMAWYVSKEWSSVAASLQIDIFELHWLTQPTTAIDTLVVGLSALLLLLAWANAAVIALAALFLVTAIGVFIVYVFARTLLRCFLFLYGTIIFAPLRAAFRTLYSVATRMRERHREKVFTEETAAYDRRKEQFTVASPKLAEYRDRLAFYQSTNALKLRLSTIYGYFGLSGIFEPGSSDADSEWRRVRRDYGFLSLSLIINYLQVFAQLAPMEFLSSDWPKLHAKLEQFLIAYGDAPDDPLLTTIKRGSSLSYGQKEEARTNIRARLATIPSKTKEIDELYAECDAKLNKLITGIEGRHQANIFELEKGAEQFFGQSDLAYAGFLERAPIRGAKDSKVVTYLLDLLHRAAGQPPTVG